MAAWHSGLYASIPLYCGALAMWIGGTASIAFTTPGSGAVPQIAGMFGFALAQ